MPARSGARPAQSRKEIDMMGIEWLRPGVFFGSMLFALIGVFIFWICFLLIDWLTPYKLWDEIVEKQNLALAIVVGAMCISIGMIVAASVHG
jgi:putative membrane protein